MFVYPQPLFDHIGFTLENTDRLQEVFTHRSAVNEHSDFSSHNERLEFLGDAVLELIATDFLFDRFSDFSEGDLTNIRSALVRGDHLAAIARRLDFGAYLILSRGERRSGGAEKDYLLANVLEAFIGAVYLEKGFMGAYDFVKRFILVDVDDILASNTHIDAKSEFQELVQERYGITPYYKVIHESGLDHEKTFEVEAFVENISVGKGSGRSKKEAQSKAALQALETKDKWISFLSEQQ